MLSLLFSGKDMKALFTWLLALMQRNEQHRQVYQENFLSNIFLLILSFISCSVAQPCLFVTPWTEAGKNIRLARPGSSVHRIFQARLLGWVDISSSRGSSQPRDQTHISCMRLNWHANSLPLNHLGIPNKQILQLDMSSTRLLYEKFNNYLLTF